MFSGKSIFSKCNEINWGQKKVEAGSQRDEMEIFHHSTIEANIIDSTQGNTKAGLCSIKKVYSTNI